MNKKSSKQTNPEDFSLGVGGPLYQLYLKTRLVDKPLFLCNRRVIAVAVLTWLPLLVLTVLGGVAISGVTMPFIRDVDVHVRFLLALPMLIYAEVIVHNRISVIVEQFLKCNIITADFRAKYQKIIDSAMRLRNSVLVEILLVALVYTVGRWISAEYIPFGVSNWYVINVNDMRQLTPAGYWYVFVSLPIFQFVLIRWYFRILVWYRFLWQVARLPLKLNSLHPDGAGGLGFLSKSVYAFGSFLLAHSILLAGAIFNRIWNAGAALTDFQVEIFGILGFLIIIPLFPLLFFMFKMVNEKRMGTMQYDVVANHYVDDFRAKWINTTPKKNEELLGTSDIQSLADLTNSFTVSTHMRITPFGRRSVIGIFILTALPLFPLILTILPLEKIINQVFGLIF